MTTGNRIIAALAAIALLASAQAIASGYLQDPALLDKIKPGVTTTQEVEQILGAPASKSDFSRMGEISLNYWMRVWTDTYDVGVMVGTNGVVREVQKIKRWPPN